MLDPDRRKSYFPQLGHSSLEAATFRGRPPRFVLPQLPPPTKPPFFASLSGSRGIMSFDPLSPSAAPSWPSSPHQPSDLPPHLAPSSPASMSPSSNSRSFSSSMAQQQAQGPPPQMGALGGEQYAKERQVSLMRASEEETEGGAWEEVEGGREEMVVFPFSSFTSILLPSSSQIKIFKLILTFTIIPPFRSAGLRCSFALDAVSNVAIFLA